MKPSQNLFTFLCGFLLANVCTAANPSEMLASVFSDKTSWVDETGAPISFAKYKDSALAVTMAYTECTKTCPMTTVAKLHELEEASKQHDQPLEIFVITMDPTNDTSAKLLSFKKKHAGTSHWHFLRCDEPATRKFAESIELGDYWKMDDHMQHKFKIQYMVPSRHIVTTLDWDHQEISDLFAP